MRERRERTLNLHPSSGPGCSAMRWGGRLKSLLQAQLSLHIYVATAVVLLALERRASVFLPLEESLILYQQYVSKQVHFYDMEGDLRMPQILCMCNTLPILNMRIIVT